MPELFICIFLFYLNFLNMYICLFVFVLVNVNMDFPSGENMIFLMWLFSPFYLSVHFQE